MSKPTDQPPPEPGKGDIWRLVLDDMKERRRTGIKRYGTPLQANNGRDALVDAYQEALDLAVYLRQAIEERDIIARAPAMIMRHECPACNGIGYTPIEDPCSNCGGEGSTL